MTTASLIHFSVHHYQNKQDLNSYLKTGSQPRLTQYVDVGINELVAVDIAGIALYHLQVRDALVILAVLARIHKYQLVIDNAHSTRHISRCTTHHNRKCIHTNSSCS